MQQLERQVGASVAEPVHVAAAAAAAAAAGGCTRLAPRVQQARPTYLAEPEPVVAAAAGAAVGIEPVATERQQKESTVEAQVVGVGVDPKGSVEEELVGSMVPTVVVAVVVVVAAAAAAAAALRLVAPSTGARS